MFAVVADIIAQDIKKMFTAFHICIFRIPPYATLYGKHKKNLINAVEDNLSHSALDASVQGLQRVCGSESIISWCERFFSFAHIAWMTKAHTSCTTEFIAEQLSELLSTGILLPFEDNRCCNFFVRDSFRISQSFRFSRDRLKSETRSNFTVFTNFCAKLTFKSFYRQLFLCHSQSDTQLYSFIIPPELENNSTLFVPKNVRQIIKTRSQKETK